MPKLFLFLIFSHITNGKRIYMSVVIKITHICTLYCTTHIHNNMLYNNFVFLPGNIHGKIQGIPTKNIKNPKKKSKND